MVFYTGVPVEPLFLLLLALCGLAAVTLIRVVGIILTIALLTIPAAIARQWSESLPRMMALGTGLAVGSAVAGLWLSLRFDLPSGAAIVLVCTAGFAAAWITHSLRRG